MKYWLFNGEDVIGPFSPQEIVARAGSSDSFLVCPEDKSEDENAWQTADHFEDFSPEKLAIRPKKEDTPKPTSTSAKVPLAITSVPISHAEDEEPVLETKSAKEEKPQPAEEPKTKAVQETPAKASSPAEKETPAETKPAPAQQATAAEQKPFSKNKIDPGLWPELSLHSLPVLGVSENTLPPLPPGNTTFYIPSKEPAAWNQPQDEEIKPAAQNKTEASPKQEKPTQEKAKETPATQASVSAPKNAPAPKETTPAPQPKPFADIKPTEKETKKPSAQASANPKPAPKPGPVQTRKPVPGTAKKKRKIPVPTSPDIPEDSPEDFFAQTLSPFMQIPVELVRAQDEEAVARATQALAPQPQEPTDFIPQKPTASSGPRFLLLTGILLTILLLSIVAGCWLARAKYAKKSLRVRPAVATTTAASSQTTEETPTVTAEEATATPANSKSTSAKVTRPDIPLPPPPTVSVSPLQEKALEIAKNYSLSNQRGTVENYFNKLYDVQLSQGYQATWSAEPLHKSTYIVKYRLTKTRTEPVVYVFQVDTATEKLTGALNNITLDLVGKI